MLEDLRDNFSGDDSIKYADTHVRHRTELPLAFSWISSSGSVDANDLYTEDNEKYLTYPSGLHKTAISARSVDRFGGLSVTILSGSVSFYIEAGDSVWDPEPDFIGGPFTVSGDSNEQSLYIGTYYSSIPESPQFIDIPSSGEYKIVFPKPLATKAMVVTHYSDAPYTISKMIPRRAVQAFDLEVNAIKAYHVSAELIETIALEVSDSIVIGPDLIGDKTIDGRKILDGTVSGVLITPGTITANEIAVSGITASRLNVTSLSAINASTGSLNVDDVITISGGEIDAGLTRITQQGITVGSFSESLPVVNRLNILGSGTINDVVGLAMYNASFSTTNPLLNIKLDSVNSVKFENNQSSGGVINFDFPENSTSTSVNIFNGDLNLRRSPATPTNVAPGAIYGYDSDSTNIWELSANRLYLASVTGDRVFEFRTDTGNFDLFGGDFFLHNSAETGVVASISKTGVAEFTASIESPTFYVDSDGTASAPSISWSSDTDTGIYRISDGYVGITSNLVLSAGFFEGQIRATNGAVDAPAYSFISDTDSGIYRSGANIAFSLNGSLAAVLTTNNVLSVNGTNQNGQITVEVPDGTARNALAIRQLNGASAFINFQASLGAGEPIQTSALGTYYGRIRVQANGTVRWIALYNT
jgi:hypothetical protein